MLLGDKNAGEIYKKLEEELSFLPGEEAHLEMFPIRGSSKEYLEKAKDYRRSAVMLVLYEEQGFLKSILTERQSYKGSHSGQMSLPGGKLEEEDSSAEAAAKRETEEEVGIDRSDIALIGKLTDVFIPVSNYLVHPFIGYLETPPKLILDPREVKTAVQYSVNDLLMEESRITTKIKLDSGAILKDIPAFQIQEKIVWGATSLILNEFKIILNRF